MPLEQVAIRTEAEVDSDRRSDQLEFACNRVLEALHKTVRFVTGTPPRHNNKRKLTEDESGHATAKRPRTNFEESVSETDIDRDNDCPICLTPWTTCGEHRLTSLKCGHLFGHSCIIRWLETSYNCPYCYTHAEVTDLRNIFAPNIKAEDTTDRDVAIVLWRKERAARIDLKKKLDRQKKDNQDLWLELNQLKAQTMARRGYFSRGFGIVATLIAVKDSLSSLSRVFRRG
ncbi:hypothetical protein BsWGS_08477 [Bradybaena similaris]